MINVGRVCVKIAGRDAGKKAVVISKIDDLNVLIDGEVRRRKCNIKHLEPLNEIIEIKDSASTEQVCKALGLSFKAKKSKERKEKPVKQKKTKVVEEKKVKKNDGKARASTATK